MNPKDAAAQAESKVRLDLLEPAGNTAIARALEFGAITKGYGVQNYLQVPISARTYLAAIQRHLDALKQCEDLAPDSLIHHLGHIGANVHIWLAAAEAGTLVDDRGPGVVGDHPINSTAPEDQASKSEVEAISRLLVGADNILDRIEALCPDKPECRSCPAAADDDVYFPGENVTWASEEDKREFWEDLGRQVGPGQSAEIPVYAPEFKVGDRVRLTEEKRPSLQWKVGATGVIVRKGQYKLVGDSIYVDDDKWVVRPDEPTWTPEFHLRPSEMERVS